MHAVKKAIAVVVGAFIFMISDATWIGGLMSGFYIRGFGTHLALVNGSITIAYLPAVLLYLVIGLGIYHFVRPTSEKDLAYIIKRAALFGFVMYAFYDLTNATLLSDYGWSVVIVDTLWGTFATTLTSTLLFLLSRRFSFFRSV